MVTGHRLVYEVAHGPIPDGMVIDHICHHPETCEGGHLCPHRGCINPDHLAAVEPAVKTSTARAARRRPEFCKDGHKFTSENTYTDNRGSRHCRTCAAERARAKRPTPQKQVREVCRNGHPLTKDNISTGPDGKGRRCLTCSRARSARYERKLRAT
ncbi:HNH endonuclease signature motif containing protein [Streptomyces sp. ISL-100]|uniref:HNH endonuclease signature motif containing protein n=1 Tax=Streptomyces sp. ISL-100 TaxID=2819173 RepID=UPI0035AB72EF